MRTVAWDERVLDAIATVNEASLEQFENLCKMALLVFHTEKQSKRRLTRTASACGWTTQQAEGVVLALAKILMDAAKLEMTGPQLQASLKGMTMPTERVDTIVSLYTEHCDMIKRSSSRAVGVNLPRYRSLDWRVDLEIASRTRHNDPKPLVTLGLNTFSTDEGGIPHPGTTCVQVDYTTLKKMQTQLEAALKEVDSVHATRMQRYLH